MLLRNTLETILRDQQPVTPTAPVIQRELVSTLARRSTLALVLTGVRRAGKSTLQAQLMQDRAHTFYCNFEDTRLFELSPHDFPNFIDLVDQIAPKNAALFFDEVQEVEGWQRLVRTLLDRGRLVCVTGSNAALLGKELGARLTGRHLSYEVFPFSYPEYLIFKGLEAGADSFRGFLEEGGFPAFLRESEPRILQELLRDIIQRDIVTRYRLRESRHAMNLALFLLANTGQPFSVQGLTKSLSIPTASQTSRYLQYLEDAYVIFPLPKFTTSFKKRIVTPNKYYAIDNGLRRVNSPQTTPDLGHRVENAVFLALRRQGKPIAYASEPHLWECDFITDTEAIQVCARLTPENQDRETRGALRGAALSHKKRKPLILTLDQDDRIELEEGVVEVQPAWKWMKPSGGIE